VRTTRSMAKPVNKRLKTALIAAAVVVALICVIVLLPAGNPVRGFFGLLVRPVQGWFSSMAAGMRSDEGTRANEAALRDENARLQAEIAALQLQLTQAREDQRRAEEVATQAGFAVEYPQHTFVPARVIAKDPSPWFVQFTVNKGSRDGVEIGTVAMTSQGIVGRVVQVQSTSCVIRALIDGQSAIAATLARTASQAMVNGQLFQGGEPQMILRHFDPLAEILPGDTIVSSGIDGLYPAGFAIGQVSRVTEAGDQSEREVLITPAVNFGSLSEVLLMLPEATP